MKPHSVCVTVGLGFSDPLSTILLSLMTHFLFVIPINLQTHFLSIVPVEEEAGFLVTCLFILQDEEAEEKGDTFDMQITVSDPEKVGKFS